MGPLSFNTIVLLLLYCCTANGTVSWSLLKVVWTIYSFTHTLALFFKGEVKTCHRMKQSLKTFSVGFIIGLTGLIMKVCFYKVY